MGLFDFGSLLGAGVDYLGQMATNKANVDMANAANQTNLAMNEANNQQNLMLTQQGWMRDDNAVQRKVRDLEAAGLSPILAAGQGASNMAPISMQPGRVSAPQLGAMPQIQQKLAAAMGLAREKQDISKSTAETDYIDLQKRKGWWELDLAKRTDDVIGASLGGITGGMPGIATANAAARKVLADMQTSEQIASKAKTEAERAYYDFAWFKDKGVPSSIDAHTLSTIARGDLTGLDAKQAVIAGALYDVLTRTVPNYVK